MQKVEKWRLRELSLSVKRLTELLQSGGHLEWANVFIHYRMELEDLFKQSPLRETGLKQMIYNLKNCFTGLSSFLNLELQHEKVEIEQRLNRDFIDERAHLFDLLLDMEDRTRDYIH
jgi:hypothetical protein